MKEKKKGKNLVDEVYIGSELALSLLTRVVPS